MTPDVAADLIAILPWHVDVRENDAWLLFFQCLDGSVTVANRHHVEVTVRECLRDEFSNRRTVVSQKHRSSHNCKFGVRHLCPRNSRREFRGHRCLTPNYSFKTPCYFRLGPYFLGGTTFGSILNVPSSLFSPSEDELSWPAAVSATGTGGRRLN